MKDSQRHARAAVRSTMAKLSVAQKDAVRRGRLSIQQDEETTVEVLASQIRGIAEAMRKMQQTGFKPEVLALIINHAIPYPGRPGTSVVSNVLEAIAELDTRLMVKKK